MIIFARHGKTVGNLKGLIMGQSDTPLTRDGIKTIEQIRAILCDFPIKTIFCSPLARAWKTASFYGQALEAPVNTDNRLAELSCGQWEGVERSTVLGPDAMIRRDWLFTPPDGESYQDGEARLKPFVKELESHQDDSASLVVSHASIGRVFFKLALGLNVEESLTLRIPHNMIFVIESGNLSRTIDHKGRVREGLIFKV